MSGVKLHQLIIKNTLTGGTEQDHLEVHHFSRSADILDRTDYLTGKIKTNPAEGMFRSLQLAELCGNYEGKPVVFGIPCNSFHAPQIYDRFKDLVNQNFRKVEVLHMIEETVQMIRTLQPGIKKIGLMSTTGTREVKVYHQLLSKSNIEVFEVPESWQSGMHEAIYHPDWGLKARSYAVPEVRKKFTDYLEFLIDERAELIILGCTEIPLALPENDWKGIALVDPMLALARALVRSSNLQKLKPLAINPPPLAG